MHLELAVTSARSKARVLDALSAAGFMARSGPVRLAYPFTVQVDVSDEGRRAEVVALARSVDPTVGLIQPASLAGSATTAATDVAAVAG